MKIGWMLYLQEESENKANQPTKNINGIYYSLLNYIDLGVNLMKNKTNNLTQALIRKKGKSKSS